MEAIPVLGQGTWGMAEDARHREDEIAALRLGLDLRLTQQDLAMLDRAFPPPTGPRPLEML